MNKCSVYCVTSEKDVTADILSMSDKRIHVAIENTDITITLTRQDKRSPYIGFAHGMEFETFGELE
jgi:hypothetical protein